MAVVRVVVKLKDEEDNISHLSFEWNLHKAPLPIKGDELAFGDRLLLVQTRRYHFSAAAEQAPRVTLHVGLTGRWARDTVTRGELLDILAKYPTVEVLG